jgi:hypothetical protein
LLLLLGLRADAYNQHLLAFHPDTSVFTTQ